MRGGAFGPILVAGLTPLVLLTLIVLGAGLGLVAWKPPLLWSSSFGTPGGHNSATTIAYGSGAVFVEGYLNNSILRDKGGISFLSEYSPDGGVLWTHTIGNTSSVVWAISEMSLGGDGIYATGASSCGLVLCGLVLRYDLTGSLVWSREFGNYSAEGTAIYASSSGVFVAGLSSPLTSQSFTGEIMFLREYDGNGNIVWTNEFSNSSGDVRGIYVSPEGVYVVGSIAGSLPGETQIGGLDAYVVKYDLSGNHAWARQFGTPLNDNAWSVTGDATGIYVSGNMGSPSVSSFGFLRKYDFVGNLDWSASISPPDLSGASDSALSLDSSGIYVSMDTGASHEFLMKYDYGGRPLWSVQLQSPGEDLNGRTAFRITTGSDSVFMAGAIGAENAHGYDFVARIASSPSLIFFGLNPPFSFGALTAVVATATIALLFYIRALKRKSRRSRARGADRSIPVRD